jgi:hypothetical protein
MCKIGAQLEQQECVKFFMVFLITGRWLHVGFQINQVNTTNGAYKFMLRIYDPV